MTIWDVPGACKLASLTIENKHLQGLDGACPLRKSMSDCPCQNFIDDFTLNQVKLHVIKMPDCAARTNCRLPSRMCSFQEQGGHKWQH